MTARAERVVLAADATCSGKPADFDGLLKEVSRSFFLTLRILPGAVRRQISLAYLLARASDTVADTRALPIPERLGALSALRDRIMGNSTVPLSFRSFVEATESISAPASPQSASSGETRLLVRLEEFISCLANLSPEDLARVREVISTIISGQELDLKRFGNATADEIVALREMAELDDYTYRVAGCVGEFWTRMCRAHLFPSDVLDDSLLLERGVRFGRGLQLINILRDVPADLRGGRCYLPADRLAQLGLSAQDLVNPGNNDRLRPLYSELLARAEAHLEAGWEYTNMIPRRFVRVRLACAWPILIGVRTAAKLRNANWLASAKPIKISRTEVRRLVARSLLGQIWPPLWRRLLRESKLV